MGKNKIMFIVIIGFLMITTTSFSSALIGTGQNPIIVKKITSLENSNSGSYEGRLRVYIVQSISRWKNYIEERYHFSFLDFPYFSNSR